MLETDLQHVFGEIAALLSTNISASRPFLTAFPAPPFHLQPAPGEASLPVLRFWPACLRSMETTGTRFSALAALLHRIAPDFRWRQNPNYRRNPPAPAFLDNYGYAEICGEYGLVQAPIRCGILILGPATCYPPHRHPAEEIYIPLTAGAWQRGDVEVADRRWIERAAGSVIHHPPEVPHATRALDHPLAALYLWRGDLKTEARLDSDVPPSSSPAR